jgi:hypothetical protein
MRENPAISDWVPISGGSTEGLLGGRLAQRQAALRGLMAAGARFDFTLVVPCMPVMSRAPRVPQKSIFGNQEGLGLGPRESTFFCESTYEKRAVHGLLLLDKLELENPKRGRTQSLLTGFKFRKEH